MATIEVTSDTYISSLSFTIDDTIWIHSGALLSIDQKSSLTKLRIGDEANESKGYLRFTAVDNVSFSSPLIEFKDDADAGILLERGWIYIAESTDIYNHRYVLRSENNPPSNEWTFSTIDTYTVDLEDLHLINVDILELFHVKPSIHFADGNQVQDLYFPRGVSSYKPKGQIKTRVDAPVGGRAVWNTFVNSQGHQFKITFKVHRLQGGKALINRIRRITNEEQQEDPVIICTSDEFGFARITNYSYPSVSPQINELTLSFEEVQGSYEEQ